MDTTPRRFRFVLVAAVVMLASAIAADAHITRIVVEQKTLAFHGQTFGQVGQYNKLTGHAYGELDPKDRRNALITDIQIAPRNARGMVEYVATFSMLVPADMSKSSGILIYEVANRGRASLANTSAEIPSKASDYFVHGDVVVASGWQGDIPPASGVETIAVPAAKNTDGSSVTGPVLYRLADMPANTNTTVILGGIGAGVPAAIPASLDTSKATLTRRTYEGSALLPVPSTEWAFADCRTVPFPGTPDPSRVCLKNGFNSANLYELVYTAKDPLVLGIGFAATRDLMSYLHHGQDTAATQNPAGKISHVITYGNSQSGNFLRTFISLGFNEDEAGQIVAEGVNANIAGRQLPLNVRFGIPGGAANLYDVGSEAALWWEDYPDPVRHRVTAGMLDRCRKTNTCPKIFETFGATEFWGLRMSPNLVGTAADADIPLPPNVRRYYFPGTTHGGGPGGFKTETLAAPTSAIGLCVMPTNPNPSSDTMRALMSALIDWVVNGTNPPPSKYPRLDEKGLVAANRVAMGFPIIPGTPLPDGLVNQLLDYDFGPNFNYNDLSGSISNEPPPIKQALPTLVPKVDADGNEVGGVPSTLHRAPLGTYLGWNIAAGGFFKGRECAFAGGYVPFAKTKAERLAAADPRPSLEERYGTHARYVAAVRAATDQLVHDRFLMREDADRLVKEADASDVLAPMSSSLAQ